MGEFFNEVKGDDLTVERITGIQKVHNDERKDNDGKKKHTAPEEHEKRNPKEYMHAITEAAKTSNELLAKKGSRYRFCVFEEKGVVKIDLVLLDQDGKIIKEVRSNINNDDFDRLINNISSIEGLLFDSNG